MRVEPPLGHGATLGGLWRAAGERRLPHALLFEGPGGIGKFLAAKELALGLLCARGPGEPCRACGPCKRVLSGDWYGNHPDLYVIDPIEEAEETIKITRIALREGGEDCTEAFLALRAMEGGWRIVIVREAQRMNEAAQNALLKTLEEPTSDTLLVLVTHRSGRLLPTIKSRCVRVRFERLEAAETLRILTREGLVGEDAAQLSRWTRGSPGDALDLARRAGVPLRALLAAVLQGEKDALEAAREASELEGKFVGRTPAARERDRARTLVDLLLAMSGDLVRRAAGAPAEELAHGDLRAAAPRAERIEALLEMRSDLDLNMNPRVVIERSLLVMADAVGVPSGS
ncbi:MAG: DNA polymerase III subunit delta' [Planctomycetota bacterium]|nr:DNA polymerase III subunit delta' [Planctomycetota bacterium]